MLKTKKSLRDSYRDKVRNGTKEYKPLRANQSLRDSYANKIKNGAKQRYVYKKTHSVDKEKAFSIFTDNLYKCVITGKTTDIHIHHIFGGSNKKNSEKYGFLIPLTADYHDMSDKAIHFNRELDLHYKRLCQAYWLDNIGTKEDFIYTFGKWW